MVLRASASCSGDSDLRSPLTRTLCAITLPLPNAVAREVSSSSVTSVPPAITPGLKVRLGTEDKAWRKPSRMRAASKMAPAPTSGWNICEECAGLPVTSSCQPLEPRREMAAVLGSPSPSSKPMAISAHSPASSSACLDSAWGSPLFSSSPMSRTRMLIRSNWPLSRRARRAWTMITSPPFMSVLPGPLPALGPVTCSFWNGLSSANTVSRCPISRRRGPRVPWLASRWPARSKGAPSIHWVLNPSCLNSRSNTEPTLRTPARFMVPLLISTVSWSSATARSWSPRTWAAILASTGSAGLSAEAVPMQASRAIVAREARRFMVGALFPGWQASP